MLPSTRASAFPLQHYPPNDLRARREAIVRSTRGNRPIGCSQSPQLSQILEAPLDLNYSLSVACRESRALYILHNACARSGYRVDLHELVFQPFAGLFLLAVPRIAINPLKLEAVAARGGSGARGPGPRRRWLIICRLYTSINSRILSHRYVSRRP